MLANQTVPIGVPEAMRPICRQPRFVPRKRLPFAPFLAVVAIHILAVYVLMLSPARAAIKSASVMMVSLIHEHKKQQSAAPKEVQATKPPSVRMPQWTLAHVPAPLVAIDAAEERQVAQLSAPPLQQAAATVAAENRVELPRFDMAYLNNPAPVYPALSKRLREQGRVLLRVRVSVDGAAEQIEIQSSSGASRLDNAAIEAVRHWRFLPARRGNESVMAWALVPINFQLA